MFGWVYQRCTMLLWFSSSLPKETWICSCQPRPAIRAMAVLPAEPHGNPTQRRTATARAAPPKAWDVHRRAIRMSQALGHWISFFTNHPFQNGLYIPPIRNGDGRWFSDWKKSCFFARPDDIHYIPISYPAFYLGYVEVILTNMTLIYVESLTTSLGSNGSIILVHKASLATEIPTPQGMSFASGDKPTSRGEREASRRCWCPNSRFRSWKIFVKNGWFSEETSS